MSADLAGWLPIRFFWRHDQPVVDWALMGTCRLADAFFDETVDRVFRNPFRKLFRRETSADELLNWAAMSQGLQPRGFIFHMSRCGSTLLSQMFGALPRCRVVSEPHALFGIMRGQFRKASVTPEQRASWLKAMITALGHPANATETEYFVKFDSWHCFHMRLVHDMFPGVARIFVIRDPVAVLASHMNYPAGWITPGVFPPALCGLTLETSRRMAREEYYARIIGLICNAAADLTEQGLCIPIDYSQLPALVYYLLPRIFRMTISEDESELMRIRTMKHSKLPDRQFQGYSEEKHRKAMPGIYQAAARWIEPAYQRLRAAALDLNSLQNHDRELCMKQGGQHFGRI